MMLSLTKGEKNKYIKIIRNEILKNKPVGKQTCHMLVGDYKMT